MYQYIKMPAPLLVLGLFYAIYAAFFIFANIGYFQGTLNAIKQEIISNKKYLLLLLILAITIIFTIDCSLTILCKNYYNQNVYTILDFFCSMSEGWFVGGLLLTSALILTSLNYKKQAIVCQIAFMSAIYAGIINGILKFIFNRQRPSIGLEPEKFFHFFMGNMTDYNNLFYAFNSMPSGHTITVTAALSVLFFYSKQKSAKFLVVFYCVFIGICRVYTINHWLSDVFVALIIGSIIGKSFYQINKWRINEI